MHAFKISIKSDSQGLNLSSQVLCLKKGCYVVSSFYACLEKGPNVVSPVFTFQHVRRRDPALYHQFYFLACLEKGPNIVSFVLPFSMFGDETQCCISNFTFQHVWRRDPALYLQFLLFNMFGEGTQHCISNFTFKHVWRRASALYLQFLLFNSCVRKNSMLNLHILLFSKVCDPLVSILSQGHYQLLPLIFRYVDPLQCKV